MTEFINSGSTEEVTIHENTTAYSKYRVRSRVLIDVSKADTSTTCFGQKMSFPLGCSPAGIQAIAHPDGETATARACAKKGVPQAISSFASFSIKDIREAGLGNGPFKTAMQMYTLKTRDLELKIIQEAERQGCSAIFLTADSPVLGVR
jgi:(S)-2-hydroxy-acid oxidase